ncbi:MAG: hypothetical protein HFH97_09320 [Lachnospiraceae bacterium]|nr:hypothetical protein [Lachnospiraceae bacterium]
MMKETIKRQKSVQKYSKRGIIVSGRKQRHNYPAFLYNKPLKPKSIKDIMYMSTKNM